MFVDRARITVHAGKGGDGMVAFRREKYVPRGGPSGGDGGRGGSVFMAADPQRSTLIEFRHRNRFVAGDGEHGGSDNCHGKDAEDVVIFVPCGTLLYRGEELVADLSQPGMRTCVAAGGRGGLGNQHFATSTRQTPRFAQKGEPGEEVTLDLQLKLLADAGIVGAPNAGKSTLLAAVSQAKPKIADYPFTTLEPQLGVVRIDVDASFVIVDLPGLIEGASTGTGLGDEFLRHIERCTVLIHVVDGALAPAEAVEQMAMIERELAAWNAQLGAKRRIIAVSKQDLPGADAVLEAVRAAGSAPAFGISAATRQGTRELMAAAYAAIRSEGDSARPQEPGAGSVVFHPKPARPAGAVHVEKEGGGFRVSGAKIERLASMTDLDSEEGRAYFERILARSGARRKLERLGLRPGDTVRVGDREYVAS